MIKFNDLGSQYQELKTEIDNTIQQVLEKGNYILGSEVNELEENFAAYIGTKYSVAVSSGTEAIELALRCLDIKEEDEVITVSNTFIATALGISACGAKIVLVDCGDDMLMDISKVEAAITSKTKAIIPVHLFGQCVDMASIGWLAEKYNLFIIEDASQAHGATNYGIKAGRRGNINCFSLYPAKNFSGIGDGGICTTDSKHYYEKLIMMRNYGSKIKYTHEFVGKNARLDTINAAVLIQKLPHLDKWNAKRNEFAALYSELLKDIPEIEIPVTNENNYHIWHLYVIKANRRDYLQQFLKGAGIETGIHYPTAIHQQPCYKDYDFGSNNSFPNTEKFATEILSLPMHSYLKSEEIEFVCEKIKAFYQ
jgi:dTDP-4-amino-4,6-dideoxygalactose transaminase